MKNKWEKSLLKITTIVIIFIGLHITPKVALRTHIFMMGYPKIALTTGIESDFVHKDLETNYIKFYIATNSPIEKVTGGELTSYKIKRIGFIYLASYYGEA